jgi:tagaturonate reductase
LSEFANDVFDRFRNPFIKHNLSSIALNSISKFKVRVLPSLLKYIELHNKIPVYLTYSFACLIRFYKGEWKGEKLPLNDDINIINTFSKIWELKDYKLIAKTVLENINYWGEDLTKVKILPEAIAIALEEIDTNDIEKGFQNFKNRI